MKLLLLLLLCLGLTLDCAHAKEGRVVTSNFDMPRISGEWYTILLASDRKEKIEENGSMRLFVKYIRVLNSSSVFIKYHKKVDGTCTEFSLDWEETEELGVYSVFYDGYNTFDILETAYNEYVMFYVLNSKKKKKTKVMELYARTQVVRTQLKRWFTKRCEDHEIAKENVLDLTKADRCLQARRHYGDQASSIQ